MGGSEIRVGEARKSAFAGYAVARDASETGAIAGYQ